MFEVGDYVINANNGICKVEDKVHLDLPMGNKDKLYYLIVPIGEKNTKLYIPVDSEKQRIRKVMDEEQALRVIDEIPGIEAVWIINDKQREQRYKEAIFSCEPKQLVGILKCMYLRNMQRSAEGKKNTTIDERYFKLAENNLHSELAFAMRKDMDEIKQLIADRIHAVERTK
nr:CarD family transcriptional regulator [Lachnospiraceae bacterium]